MQITRKKILILILFLISCAEEVRETSPQSKQESKSDVKAELTFKSWDSSLGEFSYTSFNYLDPYGGKEELSTSIIPHENRIAFIQTDPMISYRFELDDAQRDQVIGFIDKFMQWESRAILETGVIDKEIGSVNIEGFVLYDESEGWVSTGDSLLTVTFFTIAVKKHLLILDFQKSVKKYKTFYIKRILLHNKKDILAFRDTLLIKNIHTAIQKRKKQAVIEATYK